MRKILAITLVIMVMVMMSAYAGDKAWFDMENCEFCKPMGVQMDMMEEIGWEHQQNLSTILLNFIDKLPPNGGRGHPRRQRPR